MPGSRGSNHSNLNKTNDLKEEKNFHKFPPKTKLDEPLQQNWPNNKLEGAQSMCIKENNRNPKSAKINDEKKGINSFEDIPHSIRSINVLDNSKTAKNLLQNKFLPQLEPQQNPTFEKLVVNGSIIDVQSSSIQSDDSLRFESAEIASLKMVSILDIDQTIRDTSIDNELNTIINYTDNNTETVKLRNGSKTQNIISSIKILSSKNNFGTNLSSGENGKLNNSLNNLISVSRSEHKSQNKIMKKMDEKLRLGIDSSLDCLEKNLKNSKENDIQTKREENQIINIYKRSPQTHNNSKELKQKQFQEDQFSNSIITNSNNMFPSPIQNNTQFQCIIKKFNSSVSNENNGINLSGKIPIKANRTKHVGFVLDNDDNVNSEDTKQLMRQDILVKEVQKSRPNRDTIGMFLDLLTEVNTFYNENHSLLTTTDINIINTMNNYRKLQFTRIYCEFEEIVVGLKFTDIDITGVQELTIYPLLKTTLQFILVFIINFFNLIFDRPLVSKKLYLTKKDYRALFRKTFLY